MIVQRKPKLSKMLLILRKNFMILVLQNKIRKNSTPIPLSQDGQQSADTEIESSNDEQSEQQNEEKEWFTDSDPETDHRSDQDADDADLETPSYEGGSDVDETKSVTDEALAQALESLVDDNAKEWVYLNAPDPKVEDYIVPFQEAQDNLYNHFYDETRDSSWAEHVYYAVDHYNVQKRYSEDCQLSV